MLLPCPVCGDRPVSEFSYSGPADKERPSSTNVSQEAWIDYVFARRNPMGRHAEYWQHVGGCRSTLVIERDTRTHEVFGARLLGPFAASA